MKGATTAIITGVALVFLLPSCEVLKDFNVTGEVSYTDVDTGAKGGIVFGPDKPSWWLRLPTLNTESNGVSVKIHPIENSGK